MRAAMRPLLRTLIRRPGALYDRVFVGPVASRDVVEAELRALAEAADVPVHIVRERVPAGIAAPSVVLAEASDLVTHADDMGALPEGVQIILWGACSAVDLDAEVRARLSSGCVFDVCAHTPAVEREWSMGPTLRRYASRTDKPVSPAFVEAPASALPLVSDEAAIRLEAAGLWPALAFDGAIGPDEPTVANLGGQSAAVISLLTEDAPHADAVFRETLSVLGERGCHVVLVGDAALRKSLFDDPAWEDLLCDSPVVVVSSPANPVIQADRRTWPPVSRMLLDPFVAGDEPERILSGRSHASGPGATLADVVQMVTGGRGEGRIVVFDDLRLGMLDFQDGRVVGAHCMGAYWSAERLRRFRPEDPGALNTLLLREHLCEIGGWDAVQYVVTSGTVPAGQTAGLDVNSALMSVAQRMDESERRARKVGGGDRVWKLDRVDAPRDISSRARSLWPHLDGRRSVDRAMRGAGLLEDEALDAILELRDRGLATVVGRVRRRAVEVGSGPVARRLLGMGLITEATHLLVSAAKSRGVSSEARFLIAHLMASTDPAGAVGAFRAIAAEPGDALAFASAVNALLLDVRGRQIDGAAAWARCAGLEEPDDLPAEERARLTAVRIEFAARAGRDADAQSLRLELASLGECGRTLLRAIPDAG